MYEKLYLRKVRDDCIYFFVEKNTFSYEYVLYDDFFISFSHIRGNL